MSGAPAVSVSKASVAKQHVKASKTPAKTAGDDASPSKDDGTPLYTQEEVSKHKTKETGIWVTYKDGVYDVTEFIALHPGGASKIMLAAGGAVDPFWALYQQHMKDEVQEILAEYRIGRLAGGTPPAALDASDPYASDPRRHPALQPRSSKPFNGETPQELLTASLVTPTEIFYVRNHLPVPHVDAGSYKLVVEGPGLQRLELSLQDLQAKFRKHSITATVQCSGNRRNEMKAIKPVKGLEWDAGAIGTAVWGGVLLRDVLREAGLDLEAAATGELSTAAAAGATGSDDADDTQGEAGSDQGKGSAPAGASAPKHVQFMGFDRDPATGDVYGASIPLARAAAPAADVLLAWEMNGAPLNADHGAPLRVVVPGVTGARSVKWLAKIVASAEESSSHWQQKDYKAFNPHVGWDNVDWASAPAIQEAPVTSAICEPAPGSPVPYDPSAEHSTLTAKGYAWSGGGRGVCRVDVSSDGGKTWTQAQIKRVPGQEEGVGSGRAWAWVQWEAQLPLPQGALPGQEVQLVCKAVDDSYNNQPDTVDPIWNLRGVVNNAWHRVTVKLADE